MTFSLSLSLFLSRSLACSLSLPAVLSAHVFFSVRSSTYPSTLIRIRSHTCTPSTGKLAFVELVFGVIRTLGGIACDAAVVSAGSAAPGYTCVWTHYDVHWYQACVDVMSLAVRLR